MTRKERKAITILACGIAALILFLGLLSHLRAAPVGGPPASDQAAVLFNGGTIGTAITGADGTSSAPTYAFTSATNSGMYLSGTQLRFAIAGSDRGYFSGSVFVSNGAFGISGANSYIQSPSSGIVTLSDVSDTGFGRLNLGPGTSSFPALKRSSALVAFRLADDSADTGITASTLALSGTLTSSRTTDLGWSPQAAANQACNTTCTSACVFGADTAAGFVMVACTDATADVCICAGSS